MLKTLMLHFTASGFNGSPTEHRCLRLFRLYFITTLFPARISILTAVGAVYQTFTLYFFIKLYHFSGSNLPAYTKEDAPTDHEPRIP